MSASVDIVLRVLDSELRGDIAPHPDSEDHRLHLHAMRELMSSRNDCYVLALRVMQLLMARRQAGLAAYRAIAVAEQQCIDLGGGSATPH